MSKMAGWQNILSNFLKLINYLRYYLGIAPVVENKDPVNTVKMLAALQGVLSPNTFEKTKRAMQDPHLVKKMNM